MFRRGDYVLCYFPFHGFDGPGPSPHIVLCAATGRAGAARFAIVFYTTSRTEYEGARRPRQHVFVDEARANTLGQKSAFHIDASRVARLPLTNEYFPGLALENMHIYGRDPELVGRVEKRLEELLATGFDIRKVDHVGH